MVILWINMYIYSRTKIEIFDLGFMKEIVETMD